MHEGFVPLVLEGAKHPSLSLISVDEHRQRIVGVRGDKVEGLWPVTARGAFY